MIMHLFLKHWPADIKKWESAGPLQEKRGDTYCLVYFASVPGTYYVCVDSVWTCVFRINALLVRRSRYKGLTCICKQLTNGPSFRSRNPKTFVDLHCYPRKKRVYIYLEKISPKQLNKRQVRGGSVSRQAQKWNCLRIENTDFKRHFKSQPITDRLFEFYPRKHSTDLTTQPSPVRIRASILDPSFETSTPNEAILTVRQISYDDQAKRAQSGAAIQARNSLSKRIFNSKEDGNSLLRNLNWSVGLYVRNRIALEIIWYA